MKRAILIFIVVSNILVFHNYSKAQCDDESFMDNCASLLEKFVFVKSFEIEMGRARKEGLGMEYSYVFSKGTSYMMTICDNNSDDNKMILELFDRNHKLLFTNYNKKTKKYYPKIEYPCSATGVYYLKYTFSGGQPGCGVSIIGFSKK